MMGEDEAGIAQDRPGSHPVEDRDGCIEDQVPPRGGRLRLKHLFWCDCHILKDPFQEQCHWIKRIIILLRFAFFIVVMEGHSSVGVLYLSSLVGVYQEYIIINVSRIATNTKQVQNRGFLCGQFSGLIY